MSDTEMSPGDLLDTLAALDPSQRREVAEELRQVSETVAELPDGKTASHVLAPTPILATPTTATVTVTPTPTSKYQLPPNYPHFVEGPQYSLPPTTTPVPCPTSPQQRGCSWPDGPNPPSPPGDCWNGDDLYATSLPIRAGASATCLARRSRKPTTRASPQ
jgi:hypothetical protein